MTGSRNTCFRNTEIINKMEYTDIIAAKQSNDTIVSRYQNCYPRLVVLVSILKIDIFQNIDTTKKYFSYAVMYFLKGIRG